MSHVTKATTEMRELSILKNALKDLKLGYYESSNLVGKYIGSSNKADIVVDDNGDRSVGLSKNDEGLYEFVGDLSMKKNFNMLSKTIEQRYTARMIKKNLSKMNLKGIKEKTLEDGTVRLTAIRA